MKNLSLAWRIAALSVAIAVLTALLAGALTAGLVRNNGEAGARANLAHLADVAQSTVSHAVRTGRAETRLRTLLAGLSIRTGTVSSTGVISTAAPVIRRLMTPARVSTLVSGQSLSVEQTVAGDTVFLEARPVPGGGIVLAQRRADALAPNQQAIRRTLLALVIAAGIATVLGALVAWRIARPLRRTATAAHALAVGDRDVAVPADGPREVAEVADAVTSLAAALRISEGRQRDFLMSVSHDLRTPLTALRGYAESLADGAIDADDAPRVGAAMTEEARRMELLVGTCWTWPGSMPTTSGSPRYPWICARWSRAPRRSTERARLRRESSSPSRCPMRPCPRPPMPSDCARPWTGSSTTLSA